MYAITQNDQPQQIETLPQSSVGAPYPMVIAGEHSLFLAYYCQSTPQDWDGTSIRMMAGSDADELCAVITFDRPYAHMFGPPNDEAFFGHPLAAAGLRPYSVFKVENSSWLHGLVRMNSVHPYHRPERFAEYKHFIFSFHDTTFECIARSFHVVQERGSTWAVISAAQNKMLNRE